MPFTNAELRDIYTDLNIGSPGPAVDQAAVDAIAAQTRAGLISDQQAIAAVYDLVDDTTGVAALTYQFFTGSLPTEGGFQFLVNSPTNANDLNDPYYTQFNAENRFINFSFNLALGTPANQAAFAAVYGAASLEDTIRVAYDTIVGNAAAEAAGIDVEDAIDFLTGPDQIAFYRAIALSRGGVAASDTVRLDLAIKAIAIAELLYAAAQEDVGNYASALNQFYASLIDADAGSPGFGEDLLETFPPTATVTLTAFADTVTGNVFNAPRTFTPGGNDQVNTLNDDDVLTGVGDNPTLNFTFVNDSDTGDQSIAPTLNGIETINVDVRTNGDSVLDLQDATGVTNVNVEGIDDGNDFTIDNIQSIVDGSITNSNAPSSTVDFAFDEDAVEGDADAATLTLDEVELANIFFQEEGGAIVDEGIEDITIALEGDSDVGNIWVEEAEKITLTGEGSLDLGVEANVRNGVGNIEAMVRSGGFQNVAGSLVEIDASAMTGDLSINLGAEVVANLDDTSGVPVDFVFKGGSGDDAVWILGGVDSSKDKIDTGAGDDTIGVYASVTKGTITNAESLLVHSGVLGLPTTVTVDTGLFTGLEDVTVRNIGHQADGVDLDTDLDNDDVDTIVNLNKLSAAVAEEITVQHGTSQNNSIESLVLNTTFKTTTADDTLGVTIANGVNTDPRFNFTLGAASAENVTINDEDTESNSVRVTTVAAVTGVLTATGGQDGKFLDFDTGVATGVGVQGGFYLRELDGSADADGPGVDDIGTGATQRFTGDVDATAHIGDVTVRVDNKAGKSYEFGAGDDTLIFDTLSDTRAGLTISDTAAGGEGNDTLVVDGNGVIITLGASEWTNVSGFETIWLAGNGLAGNGNAGDYGDNDYNLRLTNDLIETNGVEVDGGRRINIVNDSGNGLTEEQGVTIDARTLNAKSSFSYNGEEVTVAGNQGFTNDRFIMADANINGLALIDGGAASFDTEAGNGDILEVRNSAVVTIGDLEGVQNVSTIEFTNDTASVQTSVLELDDATIDALVNSTHESSVTELEVLNIVVEGNPLVPGAATELTIEDTGVTGATAYTVTATGTTAVIINGGNATAITGGGGNDVLVGGAGAQTINGGGGNDTITGGAGADELTGGAGSDVFRYAATSDSGLATIASLDSITDFVSADDAIFTTFNPAGAVGNYAEAAAGADYATTLANANTALDGVVLHYFAYGLGGNGYLFIDDNGDGTADMAIELVGLAAAADFDFTDIT